MTGNDTSRAPTPSDRSAEFFAGLPGRSPEPLLRSAEGSIRFEVTDGPRTARWTVHLARGQLRVSRAGGAADTVVTVPHDLLDRLVSGEANATAAVLRGELGIRGDIGLLLLFQRIFPGPPDQGRARTAGRG